MSRAFRPGFLETLSDQYCIIFFLTGSLIVWAVAWPVSLANVEFKNRERNSQWTVGLAFEIYPLSSLRTLLVLACLNLCAAAQVTSINFGNTAQQLLDPRPGFKYRSRGPYLQEELITDLSRAAPTWRFLEALWTLILPRSCTKVMTENQTFTFEPEYIWLGFTCGFPLWRRK